MTGSTSRTDFNCPLGAVAFQSFKMTGTRDYARMLADCASIRSRTRHGNAHVPAGKRVTAVLRMLDCRTRKGYEREAGQEFPSDPGKGLAAIDSHEHGGTCLSLALRTRAPTVVKLSTFRLLQKFACPDIRARSVHMRG